MASYRKGLVLSLGLVNVAVDLYAVRPSTRSSFNRICPEHKTKLGQRLICDGGEEEHTVTIAEALSGMPHGNVMKVVTPISKPTFPKDSGFTLTPVPAKDLASASFKENSIYYCQPSGPEWEDAWSVFRSVLNKGKVAFVTKGAIRDGRQKLWRLDSFNNYLVLTEMVYPQEIRALPGDGHAGASGRGVPGKPSREALTMMETLVKLQLTPWDEFDSTDANEARLAEWLEGAELVTIAEPTQEDNEGNVMSVSEALKLSVAAAQAAKAAK